MAIFNSYVSLPESTVFFSANKYGGRKFLFILQKHLSNGFKHCPLVFCVRGMYSTGMKAKSYTHQFSKDGGLLT